MWYLCSEPFKTLDEARKRAIEVGRDNYDSIHREGRHCWTLLYWRWIEK